MPNPNLEELIAQYVSLSYRPGIAANPQALNKIAEAIGEAAAEAAMEKKYGSQIVKKIVIPIRGSGGPPIIDIAYEFKNGEVAFVESKFNLSGRGKVNEIIFAADDVSGAGAAEKLTLKKQVEQLEPPWIRDRIGEVWEKDRRLANKFSAAYQRDKLIVLEARTVPEFKDGRLAGIKEVQFADETEKLRRYRKLGRAGTGITDAERAIAKEEAFIQKEVSAANSKAKALDAAATKAEREAISARKQATTATKWADEAKRQETIDKRRGEATTKIKEAERLEGEAKTARASAKQATDDAKVLTKKLESKTAARVTLSNNARLTELAAAKQLKPGITSVAGSEITAAGKSVGNPAIQNRAIENTGVQASAVGNKLTTAERILTAEVKISKGLRVLALTKNLGKVAIALVLPLTFFDVVFQVALWIVERELKKRAASKDEWNRVINFILGSAQPVRVDFVDTYVPGIGDKVDKVIGKKLLDGNDAEGFLYWLKKWNAEEKWIGFVYPKVSVSLERQELTYERDGEIRYFLEGNPSISFLTSSSSRSNSKVVGPESTCIAGNSRNRFTGGPQNNPRNLARKLVKEVDDEGEGEDYDPRKYQDREVRKSAILDKYLPLARKFDAATATATSVRVTYAIPAPVLTPFDFVIFKCRDLSLEILRYVSKYYDGYMIPTAYDESTFWNRYWYEGTKFPYPIDSDRTHFCLKSLQFIIQTLSQHTTSFDDKTSDGLIRRLNLIRKVQVPAKGNPLLRELRKAALNVSLNISDAENKKYLTKPVDPDLEYLNCEYLADLAEKIESDVIRIIKDMTSSNVYRFSQYSYQGTVEEE